MQTESPPATDVPGCFVWAHTIVRPKNHGPIRDRQVCRAHSWPCRIPSALVTVAIPITIRVTHDHCMLTLRREGAIGASMSVGNCHYDALEVHAAGLWT